MPTPSRNVSLSFLVACGFLLASDGLALAQTPISHRSTQSVPSTSTSNSPSASENAKLVSERFTKVNNVEALPAACKAAFATLTREPTFALANPQQPVQASDVMSSQKLPWRRLILGGMTSDRCVIYYEKGGFATTHAVVVIDISKGDEPSFVWGGVGGGGIPHDIPELVGLITDGGFEKGDQNDW